MPNAQERRRRGPDRIALAAALLLAVGYLVQLLGVLSAGTGLVIAGAVLGVLFEVLLLKRPRGLARRLEQAQMSRPARQLLRDALLLGGLARLNALRPASFAGWLLVALLGCWAVHFVCQSVALRVQKARRLPIVTRNIEAEGLRLSPAPPRLFARRGSTRLVTVASCVTAGMAVTAGTGDARWAALVAVVCWAALAAGICHMATWLLPGRSPVGGEEALEWLDEWLAAYEPTVGMYFSGGTTSAYQANMWLSTLAALDGNPVIVLRERFMVQKIDATDIPIICVPKVAHLMHLEHSALKVLLHPANSGKTSQVLRIPTIKHAFINHGESDKLSSCNPYAKAYDQVWVAGPAARERYQLADIGVDDRDIVEVGRPQLSPIEPHTGTPPTTPTTVLYAPTWEGWTNDPGSTSVILAGERIVAALLADPGVRLLYKPHPMTGSVDPRAKEADRRIRAMIADANAQRADTLAVSPQRGADAAELEGRKAELEERKAQLQERKAELDALTATGFTAGADEAERMLRQSPPAAGHDAAVAGAVSAWEECYWRAVPPESHLVVTGRRPSVYACFNQADLLISDVSSVVSDYLKSEKPYAVVNTTGFDEDDFRASFPTVRAATVIGPDAEGIAALLECVREPAKDLLGPARTQLKAHLLGPAEPPSMTRFNQAVSALGARAEAYAPRGERAPATVAGEEDEVLEGRLGPEGDEVLDGRPGPEGAPTARPSPSPVLTEALGEDEIR